MYCTNCKTPLEDMGHEHGGDYNCKSLGCPKCHEYYDFDSRRSEQWKYGREPFYSLDETMEDREKERSRIEAGGGVDAIANDIWLRTKSRETKLHEELITDYLEWYCDLIADRVEYLRSVG
jgi:hypothetical protein